jgi:hypothetical protein
MVEFERDRHARSRNRSPGTSLGEQA